MGQGVLSRSRRGILLAATCVAVLAMNLQATDIIQTIAGGGSLEGYKPGEANIRLDGANGAGGVAISPTGELYISDSIHHQVLKINTTTGQIQIVAGNGTAAYNGDNLPAPGAGLNTPGALAFDATGNLFIVDRGNLVVRRVDALSGVITTVAGTGLFTGEVVGTNPAAPLGDGGPAIAATFGSNNNLGNSMGGIVVDAAGNIYVSDLGNDCVRKFTVGGNIATYAGTAGTAGFVDGVAATAAQLSNPTGLAIDSGGLLYIADSSNRRVRRVDAAGNINTIVGTGSNANLYSGDGGAATSADIGTLGGLEIDKDGRLLITCVGANRIRRVDIASATPNIFTIAGGGTGTIGDLGPATGAILNGPRDVVSDAQGNIYIYDAGHHRIRRVDAGTGFIDTVIGTGLLGFVGDRGPYQQGILIFPQGATLTSNGNLFVADTGNNSVRLVGADGNITTFAGNGAPGANQGVGDGGPANLASLSGPTDVAVFGSNLFIADTGHDLIRKVDLTTNIITTFATVTGMRGSLIVDGAGILYAAVNNTVVTIDTAGTVTTYVGSAPMDTATNPRGDGLPAANATLTNPYGLAIGPFGELYIAERGNDRVRVVGPAGGTTSTIAGGGTQVFPAIGDGGPATAAVLNNPTGVAVIGGTLFITDTDNHRIRSVDIASNTINTYCGTGVPGFSGDGDVVASAQLNFPGSIYATAGGLIFADMFNNRIRRITTATDIDPKLLSFAAKLNFAIDKKTGQIANNKDSVSMKAGLPLPAGITAANLKIQVDIIDLHQGVQLDAKGKQPKAVKAAKASKVTPVFNFNLPAPPPPPVSKFSLSLKGTSVAGAKPTSFSFASKGTFRDELGRAGFTNVTTAKEGVNLPVRVNVTLGTFTFTGLTTVQWKATQGKSGAAKSIKQK